ncbi:glycosyltransferase family 2 protein [Micromonospora sp. S4605]|uniref:glycosyltransferase family 2 protein n=1 Tax=Micromonospora sp. S4605 TaxID=1420897 RepID=UPI0013051369|nr:glycosyltransferase [Micromonospora sp. S4605]
MSKASKTARWVPGRALPAVVLMLGASSLWLYHHVTRLEDPGTELSAFEVVYTFAFVVYFLHLLLATFDRPRRVTAKQAAKLAKLRVVAVVPLYNEDVDAVIATIRGLLGQTRRPDAIFVRDDGSNKVDYLPTELWAVEAANAVGVPLVWVRDRNRGKRATHVAASLRFAGWADAYLTIDSDSVLAPDALENLIKPLADPKVMSVAGVFLTYNLNGPIARAVDLICTASQLTDRSATSALGSVLVNSGGISLYRARVIDECRLGYSNEEFFGRRVEFSDDSYLTLQALLRGKTVQQSNAFAFCVMPERLSNHRRQFMRWLRGSFIRSFWRFKYLPLNRIAYWLHALKWVQAIASTIVVSSLFVVKPVADVVAWARGAGTDALIADAELLLLTLGMLIVLGYVQLLRIFTVRRSDQTMPAQLGWFLFLSPVAILWQWSVLRVWRLWAIASCMRFKWGTRQQVEVEIGGDHEKVLAGAAAATTGWMRDETVIHYFRGGPAARSDRDRSGSAS